MTMRRRYEVWFVRLGLTDGSGAWWFRYLLTNPGRGGCDGIWRRCQFRCGRRGFRPKEATDLHPGISVVRLGLSHRGQSPFHFRIGENSIDDNSCKGSLRVDGHAISWNLHYRSTFHVTLSNKGWIGFSRSPHSDAIFAGEIKFDGRSFAGDSLGFGVQGHNCGYRHRNFWRWTHVYFSRAERRASTLEALIYEMPFGLVFRKAVLWHDGQEYVFRDLREAATAGKVCGGTFGVVARRLRLKRP